jgi:hypothetical protein
MNRSWILVFALFTAMPVFAQGCDYNALSKREDIRYAIDEAYRETVLDETEHGLSVGPHTIEKQGSGEQVHITFHLPMDTIAFFHIHPRAGWNRPSPFDISEVIRLQKILPGVCSYVLGRDYGGRRTVFEIFPNGSVEWVGIL